MGGQCPSPENDILLTLATVAPICIGVLLVITNKFFNQSKVRVREERSGEMKRRLYVVKSLVRSLTYPSIVSYSSLRSSQFRVLSTAAEKTKRNIYEYRTRTGAYNNEKFANTKLSAMVAAHRGILNKTEAVKSRLTDGETKVIDWIGTRGGREDTLNIYHPNDIPLRQLDIDSYILVRLQDSQRLFSESSGQLSKTFSRINILLYILGGVGTVLVVFGLYIWVGVSLAMVNAVGAILNETQVRGATNVAACQFCRHF